MNNQVKLKKGDWVVMHTCGEATDPDNYGKLWRCKTDEYTKGQGVYEQNLVFLEGFSGCFSTEFLQKVNLPDIPPVPTIGCSECDYKGYFEYETGVVDEGTQIKEIAKEPCDCVIDRIPTIKPGDKVRHEMHGYGTAHVTFKDSKNVLVAFNKCQHAVIVSAEELEVVE